MSVRGILTMALATVAMACGQQSRSNVRQVGGNLYAEPSAVDFGDVALGKEQSTSVLLRNDGILKMTVDSLPGLPGESAFVVTGLPVELAPGQVARVEVKYQPGDTGSHARKVELVTDAPGAPQSNLELRGHAVRGLARLSGDVIDFGDVVLNEGAIQMLSLNNNDGHAATSVVIAHPEGANAASFAVGRVGTLPLGPEESLSVRLDFSPDHLGEYTALLQVTPCPTCAARTVTLVGSGVERLVSVSPAALDFGEVLLGSARSLPFTVSNTSRNQVQIKSLDLGGSGELTATLDNVKLPLTLAAGEHFTGVARFAPTSLGEKAANITLHASDGAPAGVDLKGLGMGALVQTRPHSLFVGSIALGTTRGASVSVTNIGLDPSQTAPLALTSVSIRAQDAGWKLDSASSVQVGEPGSATSINFSYTPEVAGTVNAVLVIESNDGLQPRLEVPLSAQGRDLLPCQLAVSPGTTVDFGAVPVFHPTTQGFELQNSTATDCIVGEPQLISGGPAFRWPGGVNPSGRTLAPGSRMSVRVEFVPEKAISYDGEVRFYVSNKAAPSLSVHLTAQGDTTCFFVTPGAVDFGGATQGCNAPDQTAYAVNQCSYVVHVTDVHTSGAPFLTNNPGVPFDIAPNTSVNLGVSYRAASPGDDVGQLFVTASTRATPYQVGLTAGSAAAAQTIDRFDQSSPKVDLLIVIDNSGSMAEEQHALQANLDKLWTRIALANADFHIAVTTSGMAAYTSGWTQCPGGAQGGEAGRFFPVDASRPRVLTAQTPNVKDVLFANTNVGLCHWDERFLDPVMAALTDPLINATKAPGTLFPADGNAGFLRDDARLALMAVTDTDDDDDIANPPPVADYVKKLVAIKHGALDLISFAGIVPLHACASAEGVGNRFMEISRQLNGHLEDICDLNNFGPMIENSLGALLQPLSSFPLSQHPRDASLISVTINGAQVTGFTYEVSSNRIVFARDAIPAPGAHIEAKYDGACN